MIVSGYTALYMDCSGDSHKSLQKCCRKSTAKYFILACCMVTSSSRRHCRGLTEWAALLMICRYGFNCLRPDCWFQHPEARAGPRKCEVRWGIWQTANLIPTDLPMFGSKCYLGVDSLQADVHSFVCRAGTLTLDLLFSTSVELDKETHRQIRSVCCPKRSRVELLWFKGV